MAVVAPPRREEEIPREAGRSQDVLQSALLNPILDVRMLVRSARGELGPNDARRSGHERQAASGLSGAPRGSPAVLPL